MLQELNTRQKLVVVLMDLLLLTELTLCIYLGSADKDTLPMTFMRTYVPMCVATVVICRLAIRRLGGRNDAGGGEA